ncbi:MAG: DEAD/DEAH box helicase, partial [archaeon GB-1867-035]|nr:DEAD/DEAH box helicase [Candidatus Culexmicrobium profundum]
MSEMEIVRKILDIYENYNPFFNYLIPEAKRTIIPYLHQVEFTARTMLRKPLRTLIADEIGLGKTITALAILRKMWRLGIVRKVLVLVPRILVQQWIMELKRIRFDRWIKRIERDTINYLVYEGFPDGIYIASMDLIKRDPYFEHVKKVDWDMIIVDEAHRLGKDTERFKKIGEGLIGNFPDRHVLLLSATPHRGDPEDYLSRLRILDPYLLPGKYLDNVRFYSLTHNVLIFRRSKTDINELYEGRKIFTDCRLEAIVTPATIEEQEYHTLLIRFLRTKLREFYERIGKEAKALGLLTALIFKRASSSPYAAMRTMENMLKKRAEFLRQMEDALAFLEDFEDEAASVADAIFGLSFDDYSDYYEDVSLEPDEVLNKFAAKCSVILSEEDEETLRKLFDLAKRISENDSRLKAVKLLVKAYLKQGRKVIVFSEYKDTVNYVYNALVNELGSHAVIRMTSDEVSDERKFRIRRRRFEKDPECKVMVATDVASEGLNLQVASVVINYEIPWSPIKLEQRMGRVWRLGQTRDVIINTIF